MRSSAGSTRRWLGLGGLALWLLVVVPLALLVRAGWAPLLDYDRSVVDALEPAAARSSAYQVVLDVVTTPGTSWFRFLVLAPVVVWAFRTHRARLGWLLVVAGGSVGLLAVLVKDVVGRMRPDLPHPIYSSDSLSFPSGHSAGIVTLVGLLLIAFLRVQRTRIRVVSIIGSVLLVLAVGWTRMALGAHYPSDVLAGFAFGAGLVLILAAVFDAIPPPQEEHLEDSRLLQQQRPGEERA